MALYWWLQPGRFVTLWRMEYRQGADIEAECKRLREELRRKPLVAVYPVHIDRPPEKVNVPSHQPPVTNEPPEWHLNILVRDQATLVIERRLEMSPISITGSTFIGNQLGGVANNMDTYIEQLNVGGSASEDEKRLKETLIELRKETEGSPELGTFARKSATADIDMLTTELTKPADKQDKELVKGFWSRLIETVAVSAGLTTIAMALGKILGFVP